MPIYFFDVRDNEVFFLDDEGTELDGVDAARKEALAALLDYIQEAVQTRPTAASR